jgi:hypothetical protein
VNDLKKSGLPELSLGSFYSSLLSWKDVNPKQLRTVIVWEEKACLQKQGDDEDIKDRSQYARQSVLTLYSQVPIFPPASLCCGSVKQ